jgi:hypothetical protein
MLIEQRFIPLFARHFLMILPKQLRNEVSSSPTNLNNLINLQASHLAVAVEATEPSMRENLPSSSGEIRHVATPK